MLSPTLSAQVRVSWVQHERRRTRSLVVGPLSDLGQVEPLRDEVRVHLGWETWTDG